MTVRITVPEEAILAEKQFPEHFFSQESGLIYLGTHFQYDVYVQTKGFETGSMYCVYGIENSNYYSGVGYGLVRTNRPSESIACYHFAASCALLNNPEYIPLVLKAHRG